ncbi:glycoside hydrolase family 2 protein [Parabacteroides sp. FAFU027]|uniref:glycoside hydrolase family 2 protein n=1 Tax=Parabacteroides sp. FAFU027 TaxID=2922715 RepID=UPI001FAEC0FC|nr:glycoside hydrolase family 2 TIM barrel-domain containing protein [Parabacteroides sp. FAFU027]
MNKQCFVMIVLLSLLQWRADAREKILLNFNWKFQLNEQSGAMFPTYNDAKWQSVNLPHDASIYGPFVKDTLGGTKLNGYRPRHIGWYRKNLQINENIEGKKVYLEFEGVYRESDVWVNGKHCGRFLNGYLDFQYDITDLVKRGSNVIAVRYDNTFTTSSRWYTGEGITRNVYLNILDKLHVARYGTYITTPKITDKYAKTCIETTVENTSSDSTTSKLVTDIVSPTGSVVASRTSVISFGAKETVKYRQEVKVPDPMIWDLNSPHLYKAVSKVYNGEQLTDSYETTFGIREVEFTPEEGFLLNGKKVFLKGVCLHHDLGSLGAAAFEAGWQKRLEVLKNQMGCNAIRLSHNPYPKYVLDWCDRNGILVFDEAYDKWNSQYYGPGNSFDNYWENDVATFIKRDRNHPSVFIWSVGNEVIHQYTGEDSTYGVLQLKKMVDFVHALEPSRKVTCALYPARYNAIKYNNPAYYNSAPHQMAFFTDVMSVNYQAGFFKKDHIKYPQLIFLLSEEGTGEGGYGYFGYDHTYACGQFYWGGTEYLGESFGWPSKGWINGAIDLCNNLKPVAYSISSFYKSAPMMKLAVYAKDEAKEKSWNDFKIKWLPMYFHWNWKDKEPLTVQTISNCDSVELIINGKSQGIKSMAACTNQKMTWNVNYEKGEIKALGRTGGKVVSKDILRTAGEAQLIILEADKKEMKADGLDLTYINVKVVDKSGNIVPNADHLIRFSVKGAGTNSGVGNGDILSDELLQADSRRVYNGTCQLIIRSSQMAGEIKISASAKGLKPAVVVIKTH